MKLTKLQRYTAYCILLEEAEEAYAIIRAGGIKKTNFGGSDIGGVCDIIENIFNFYIHRPLHFLSLTEFLNKKYYHRGGGEVVIPNKDIQPSPITRFMAAIFNSPIYAYCEPSLPVGWIEGEEVYLVARPKSHYDDFKGVKRIWITTKTNNNE